MRPEKDSSSKDIYDCIQDNVQQIFALPFFVKANTPIEELRKIIAKIQFGTLEERTGKTTKELEKAVPEVCSNYNTFVRELQNPEITMETLVSILEEAANRKWFSKPLYFAIADNADESLDNFRKLRKHLSIEMLKVFIKNHDFKTLSEYCDIDSVELESSLPGVSSAFADLISKFKKPDLTMEEFDAIMKQLDDRSWYVPPKE